MVYLSIYLGRAFLFATVSAFNFLTETLPTAHLARADAAPSRAPHPSLLPHMLFELWRWKPRLVWLVMHAATLGLLWCSCAWPTQAQFGVLLATTAALYVSISFIDPGYVELASASALAPDRASLSALAVPLVLQACHPTQTSADLGCYRPLARHASSPLTYSTYVVQHVLDMYSSGVRHVQGR